MEANKIFPENTDHIGVSYTNQILPTYSSENLKSDVDNTPLI